jgi:hypothetical protein
MTLEAPRSARSTGPADATNQLSVSLREFREYAAEWKALASAATTDGQRSLYLKMASIWLHAAIQFETPRTARKNSGGRSARSFSLRRPVISEQRSNSGAPKSFPSLD